MKKIVAAGVISSILALAVGGGAGWWMYHNAGNSNIAAAKTEAVSSLDESNSLFVSLPETIVTLHGNDGSEHYISAELVMVVENKKDADKIKQQEPLYQSITAERLSEMKYEEARSLKISGIRQVIADSLQKELKMRNISKPYKDVLVKKVVFQ